MSIGSRSQSARTYLEKNLATFLDCTKDELVVHGLNALQDTLPTEVEMSIKNVSIAVVGLKEDFHILSEEETAVFLGRVATKAKRGAATSEPEESEDAPARPAADESMSLGESAPDAGPSNE